MPVNEECKESFTMATLERLPLTRCVPQGVLDSKSKFPEHDEYEVFRGAGGDNLQGVGERHRHQANDIRKALRTKSSTASISDRGGLRVVLSRGEACCVLV